MKIRRQSAESRKINPDLEKYEFFEDFEPRTLVRPFLLFKIMFYYIGIRSKLEKLNSQSWFSNFCAMKPRLMYFSVMRDCINIPYIKIFCFYTFFFRICFNFLNSKSNINKLWKNMIICRNLRFLSQFILSLWWHQFCNRLLYISFRWSFEYKITFVCCSFFESKLWI